MDMNTYVENAIKGGIEAKKDELIKQTLEEDHDYIMFKLHKIFGGTYKHIENYLNAVPLLPQEDMDKVLNILANMMDEIEEAVTGEKKCNCDGTCKECTCGKELVENEEDPERIMLEEIPVDKQKRITIAYNTLYEARLETEHEFSVLKSKEGDNVFYIVSKDFNYDTNRIEFVKTVNHDPLNSLRIGIGKLLDVNVGDIVSVDVYDGQLVIYNTGSNVEDLTEGEVEEEPEEEQVTNTWEKKEFSLNDLLKEVQEKLVKNKDDYKPWFIRHYRIEI